MTAEELVHYIEQARQGFRNGELTNTEFMTLVAWITYTAQGNAHPTAAQMRERIAEIESAARFLGENPAPAEVDAATAFVSRSE